MSKKKKEGIEIADSNKRSIIEPTIAQIEKTHGKGSIMPLGSSLAVDVPVIPTGCIQLDIALGVGGYPRGKIIEIYGPESSGKTTLTIHAIAEAQKLNIRTIGIVDTNSDPNQVDYPIPGNDDASKSIKIIMDYLVACIKEGLEERSQTKDAKASAEA